MACSQRPTTGEGPAALYPEMQAGYQKFQRTAEPFFFAVSIDGRTYAYTNCPAPGHCKRANARHIAIRLCEKHSGGVPCRIYANANGIIWDGPALVEPSALTKTAPPIPDAGPSKPVTLIQCKLPDGFRLAMVPERCVAVGGEVQW